MRLWSLHPRYLDAKGLVALWREGLLAQKVLRGGTRGYTRHPQLERFRGTEAPEVAIAAYLREVLLESRTRGYDFDGTKIGRVEAAFRLSVTRGQLLHEWEHLQAKLRARAPERVRSLEEPGVPEAHALFHVVPGDVEPWEVSRARKPR